MDTIYENDFDTIVLAGSSSRGIAVLGALQYCYDNNLLTNVQNYLGTSSGFIINYLLVIGYTPVEILVSIFTTNLLEDMQKIDYNSLIKGNGGLVWDCNIGKLLNKMTLEKIDFIPTFKQIVEVFNKKLTGITFNVSLEKMELLSYENTPDLCCIEAAKMSSNLPFLFEKCKQNGCYYIDGGIVNNFPIDIAQDLGSNIIGICTYNQIRTNSENNNKIIEDDNQLNFLYRLIFMSVDYSTKIRIEKNDTENILIIKIPTGDLKSYNFKINSKEKFFLFSEGYKTCEDKFKN